MNVQVPKLLHLHQSFCSGLPQKTICFGTVSELHQRF